MDQIRRAFYEMALELRVLKSTGQAFQDLFADVMEKRYPGDFHRVKPWGRLGDLKNDGYLSSERTLFQVYAPSELEATETIAKMEEDFEGGYANWGPHCDRWVFVTRERGGTPAPIEKELLELGGRHSEVSVASWGFEDLRRRVFELDDEDVAALLGPAFSLLDVAEVPQSDLGELLETVAGRIGRDVGEVKPVPQGKLDANGLSEHVRVLLTAGMHGAPSVEGYFRDHYQATRGDEVAVGFRTEYDRLKATGALPDDIFLELRVFTAGPLVLTPRLEAAALALLAYLFERCEIFEEPRSS